MNVQLPGAMKAVVLTDYGARAPARTTTHPGPPVT